jgi:hypothetical protein
MLLHEERWGAGLTGSHARRVRAAWEAATAMLQGAGLPATFETVCALVAAGTGFPAKHARGLIEQALAGGAR